MNEMLAEISDLRFSQVVFWLVEILQATIKSEKIIKITFNYLKSKKIKIRKFGGSYRQQHLKQQTMYRKKKMQKLKEDEI